MIKNLAIKGGGCRGEAYRGALYQLELAGILQKIEKVSGVSAGAITAGLISLKYSASDISSIMQATPLGLFEEHNAQKDSNDRH